MAEVIIIAGESGAGKSTSIENLNHNETFIIAADSKPLPFPKWKSKYVKGKNYKVTREPKSIIEAIKKLKENKNAKNIIIDDYQYISAGKLADGINSGKTKGNAIFDRYNEIFVDNWNIFEHLVSMRDDQYIFLLTHIEESRSDFENKKQMKTVGLATQKHMTPEGKARIVLFAEGKKKEDGTFIKYFRTNGDGVSDTCKSPKGMFEELEIPNDLNYVIKKIKEYDE